MSNDKIFFVGPMTDGHRDLICFDLQAKSMNVILTEGHKGSDQRIHFPALRGPECPELKYAGMHANKGIKHLDKTLEEYNLAKKHCSNFSEKKSLCFSIIF